MVRLASPFLILFVSLVYAVFRYHERFWGSHNLDQVPLFIVNKAVSVAAIGMIGLAVAARTLARGWPGGFGGVARDRRRIGMTGFGLAGLHTLLSLAILTPNYFGKLYKEGGQMHLMGELSILAGAVAVVLLVWQSRLPAAHAGDDRRVLRRLGLWVLLLTGVHVAALGWRGWLEPGAWPGGLPPITLLSCVIAMAGLVLGLWPSRRRR